VRHHCKVGLLTHLSFVLQARFSILRTALSFSRLTG
jgi:hypothetical protein